MSLKLIKLSENSSATLILRSSTHFWNKLSSLLRMADKQRCMFEWYPWLPLEGMLGEKSALLKSNSTMLIK